MPAANGERRQSPLTSVGRTVLAMLTLLPFMPARGQPLTPDLLPLLTGATPTVSAAPVGTDWSWQLHQSLTYQPDSWQGRLELQPSVTISLHDPEAVPRQAMATLSLQLQSADQRQQQGLAALSAHRDFLLFQYHLHLEVLLMDWLASAAMLPQAVGRPQWRADHELAEVELLLQETRNELGLLWLRLSSAGVTFSGAGEQASRPRPKLGSSPLAACLASNLEIRRLGLLQDYQQLEAELHASSDQLKVDLNAGLTVSLGASPSAGWNLGLTVARPDHTGGRLQLTVSPQQLSQSFTIRGPDAPEDRTLPDGAGISGAIAAQAQQLRGLLLAREQAEAREAHARELAEAELAAFELEILGAGAHLGQLTPVYQALIALAQSAMHHDQLWLQLALECGLPPAYEQVEHYP